MPKACTIRRSTSTWRARARAKEEVYADIRAKLAVLPVSVAIGQPIAHRIDHMLSGIQAQIVLKIFGEDLDTLRSLAETVRTRLQSIAGLVDLKVEKQVLIPQLKVTPDYERAALYGITPAALTEALEALSNGRVVSQIVEGNRRFDVVMRMSDEKRSTTGLQDLLVSTPKGFVPLRLLAKVEEGEGPNQIQRENGQRRIVVSRQQRRQARHGGHRCRHPPGHCRDAAAVRLHPAAARNLPGAGGSRLRHRPPVAGLARADLHGALPALPVGRAGLRSS